MQQRWWIAIVAVIGIGLAIMLFPRPDTGGDIPSPNPANTDPMAFKDGNGAGVANDAPRSKANPDRAKAGPKPKSVIAERRSRTEVIYASKLVTPFSAIRYTLMRMKDDPNALAMAEELGAVANGDLRAMRLDPDSISWEDLESKTSAIMDKVAASEFAKDPTVAKSLERYKEFVAEYHTAKANEGKAPEGSPDGEQGSAEDGAEGDVPEGSP